MNSPAASHRRAALMHASVHRGRPRARHGLTSHTHGGAPGTLVYPLRSSTLLCGRSHPLGVTHAARTRRQAPPTSGCAVPERVGGRGDGGTPTREAPTLVSRVQGLAVGLGSAILLSTSHFAGPALAEDLTINFPASRDPVVRRAQETLVEAWGYVQAYYVDNTFNGQDWQGVLQSKLDASFRAKSEDEVYDTISDLLKTLDDPFTRILTKSKATKFSSQMDGKVVTLGLGAEISEDKLKVTFVANGSPASRQGIKVGDTITAINGVPVTQETAAAFLDKLKTYGLEEIDIEVDTPTREPISQDTPASTNRHLAPAPVDVNPIQYAVLKNEDGSKTGYIRLVVFSDNASKEMELALADLKEDGVSSLLLDMRDNPGGMTYAALDIAKLFLKDGDVFMHITDKYPGEETVRIQDARLAADLPMAVLVNNGSASTSEMLAGALHDNLKAPLVGEKTFGKGRTQRIVKLKDGSILLVSTILYQTPSHQLVDKVGIAPDVLCRPDFVEAEAWMGGEFNDMAESLKDDPCVQRALSELDITSKA